MPQSGSGPKAKALAGTRASGAALGPVVTLTACGFLPPDGSLQRAGPGRGSKRHLCRSFIEAGQGTACPSCCCSFVSFSSLTTPAWRTLAFLTSQSHAVPSTGSHSLFSRTLRCPKCTAENGLGKKPTRNILMQCLTLLLWLQTPGRGIKKSLMLTIQHSSLLQPILHRAARLTESQMNAIHLDPSQNINQPETGAPRAVHVHGLGRGDGCNCIPFGCTRLLLAQSEAGEQPQ